MKRQDLIAAAKLLGVSAVGKNDEIQARVEAKLKSINAVLNPDLKPANPETGVRLAPGRKLEDGRKGLHPITGEPIFG